MVHSEIVGIINLSPLLIIKLDTFTITIFQKKKPQSTNDCGFFIFIKINIILIFVLLLQYRKIR